MSNDNQPCWRATKQRAIEEENGDAVAAWLIALFVAGSLLGWLFS